MHSHLLARTALFEGLDSVSLDDIAQRMKLRHFKARDMICRQDEMGKSLFVVVDGLADVLIRDPRTGDQAPVVRLRRGDVIGEMSLITGEPRSATVLASVPTDTLEIDQPAFAAVLAQYPAVQANLNAILGLRLMRTNLQQLRERHRGEAVALVVGRRALHLLPAVVAATKAASPRRVATLDLGASLGTALATLDDLLSDHGIVLIPAALDHPDLALLTSQMDRVIILADEEEVRGSAAATQLRSGQNLTPEAMLLVDGHGPPEETIDGVRIVRSVAAPSTPDVAWLGRHLARAKLGLALGAGGARGYAHIGALQVLQRAGYTVDYVAGSSIGAVIGAWLALGKDGGTLETIMRDAFNAETVAAMFNLSMAGTSTGLPVMTRVFQETTSDSTFTDLVIPLVAMTVDLNTRQPAPLREGPLWEALLAATALAGLFPPYVRGDQRLVDGLALVPVPTAAVRALGADVVVSVNIMNNETLPTWPGEAPPEPPERKAKSRMLDTLLEVMDLAQLESSIRHAAMADVVISPTFGPSSWRDFHLADRFLAAGRERAEEQLTLLRTLATPQA